MTAKKSDVWRTIGRRKSSVARVIISNGKGQYTINKRNIDNYFGRDVLKMVTKQPFELLGIEGKYNVDVNVKGGGLSGQAGAIRHGISKALSIYDTTFRPSLKKNGFLTRDSRVVERKKFGLAKARRSYQFSKR